MMKLSDIERFAGEELTLDDIKRIIPNILSYITSGKVRLFLYNVFPEDNSICIATDIAISYTNDIDFKIKCIDPTGYTFYGDTLAMDYFKYILVITEKAFPNEELEVFKDIKEIADELSKIEEVKKKVIKATLYLSTQQVELGVEISIPDVAKILEEWFRDWLGTGRYTPVFLFKTMVHALQKSGLSVVPTILEREYHSLISLLY